jgi:hypothetical protein
MQDKYSYVYKYVYKAFYCIAEVGQAYICNNNECNKILNLLVNQINQKTEVKKIVRHTDVVTCFICG